MPDKLPESYRELKEMIGEDAARTLCRMRGGESIYIPKEETIACRERIDTIRQEWDGTNTRALAEKYGLTSRRVQQIVADAGCAVKGQIDMWEELNGQGM